MLEFDASQLAPDMAGLLLTRGTELPTLEWHAHPKHFAKTALAEIDDIRLFGRDSLMNEAMAAAVRALLALWNGWPNEAQMFAQSAPDKERVYVTAFCERQLGHTDLAKSAFSQIADHPIYPKLAEFAIKTENDTTHPLWKRFQELLQFGEAWEPFLFIDLIEQTRAGKLDPSAEATVRRVQCREFDLLFQYCFEKATGAPVPQRPEADSSNNELNLERLRRLRERRQPKTPPRRSEPAREAADPPPDKRPAADTPSSGVRKTAFRTATPAGALSIRCPKCNKVMNLPESARGKTTRCTECGTAFAIPNKGATTAGAAGVVSTRCPKCAEVVQIPESARGQKIRCGKCKAVFLVPDKQPAQV